jgi:hypothetical protein
MVMAVPPRMDIVQELGAALEALRREGVPHALCGGFALPVHGVPRATKDIDLLVPEADVGRAEQALRPAGFTPWAGPLAFGAGTAQERRLQRVTKVAGGARPLAGKVAAEEVPETWSSRDEKVSVTFSSAPHFSPGPR